ncbi:MAG: AAA family ATPase [Candidatus Vogelbacteria bacterium]|nr:AAA family ATPase [Candidatus Vogelbacteria bacterium]
MSNFSDTRGSIWRKWDLHVHTPGTKKNDQYKADNGADVWDIFCKKIEDSDVQAVGITDYFSADSYFNFLGKFGAKYPDSQKAFFPNIELCTNDVVNAGNEEVNLHLVFNPSAPEIDAKIRTFLQSLKTNKTVSGGRNIKASELSSQTDYEEATTTRQFIEEALSETFGDKVDLTEYVIVLTAVNGDGLRTETEDVGGKRRGKKRKAVITDELDKFSNGFFGNSGNTAYFLNKDRFETDEEIEPKPVVTGSDAHSFADLDEWLGKIVLKDGVVIKQSVWIKADLTFEGLRQIIFEPECRVFIGEEPDTEIRARSNPRKFIESIRITHISGYDGRCGTWFKDENIPLNKELVAIIGNKGSGKSALTDVIGLLGNSHNQKYEVSNGKTEELFSFLNKEKFLKGHCAANFNGELHWYAGDPDVRLLNAETDISVLENVEYLPQKYLEKICSNIEDDEFRHKLNEVIFGYVEDKDRYGKTSLEALIDYLSNQTREDIALAQHTLHEENEKVVAAEKKLSLDYRKEVADKIRLRNEESAAHDKTKPTVVPKPVEGGDVATKNAADIAKIETEIAALDSSIRELQKEQTAVSKDAEELRQLKQTIERQVKAISDLKPKYDALLTASGIRFDDLVTFSAKYEKLDEVVQNKASRIGEIEIQLRTEESVASLDPVLRENAEKQSLVCKRSQLEKQRKEIIDQLDKPNREYQAYLKEEAKWQKRKQEIDGDNATPDPETLNGLKQELERITSVYPEELRLVRNSRDQASKAVLQKKEILISFYNSVKQSIDKEIERYAEDLGDYEISIEASLRFDTIFHDEFFKYINQGVKGSFYGYEEGKTLLKQLTEKVNDWENENEVIATLQSVVSHLDSDEREGLASDGKARDVFRQMKQGKNPVDFYDFLFGFGYLQTKYDLRVDGKDLSELSPGERGGLLLIFYLMLDRRDIPLVIDQPEDNLDNKSVYEILVTFLKKAKKRRQIIMATHNPNLAVVADAEQIIHVSIDKKNKNDFDFSPGAIENPDTNKRVIDILEGTLPAFDNRRLKYRKQIKNAPTV